MPRGRPALIALVGVLLVAVPPAVWLLSRPAADVGAVPTTAAPVPPSQSPSSPAPGVTPPAPDPTPLVAPDRARSGLLSARAARPAVPPPAHLRIPAIGVDAPVVAVGVEPDGEMEIPARVAEIGWYRHGPTPGAHGSAVLAGHVDSRSQGRGAFFGLERLAVGDRIEVVDSDGTATSFEVTGRRRYGKDVIPLDDVFDRDGPPRLALITCGGAFDAAARRYLDNVVVYAVPVD